MMKYTLLVLVLIGMVSADAITCGKYICTIANRFKDFPRGEKVTNIQKISEVTKLIEFVSSSEQDCLELTREEVFADVDKECANRGPACLNVITDIFALGEQIHTAEKKFIGKVFDYLVFASKLFNKLNSLVDNCKDSQ